jgi:hypothetical protein
LNSGPCRRWSVVHQVTSLQPAGHPCMPRSTSRVTVASALRRCARRVGAAACDMAGLWPSRGSTLGCAGHQRAGVRIAPDARTKQRPSSQRRSPRRRGGVDVPCTQMRSTPAGSQGYRMATTSTRSWKVQVLQAVAGVLKHTWLTCDLDHSVPGCVATAVLAHERPRHASLGAANW